MNYYKFQHDRFRSPLLVEAQGRSLSGFLGAKIMAEIKPFKKYSEQIKILQSRGMKFSNVEDAIEILKTHNYYRLAGYWHSMRNIDKKSGRSLDSFRPGTTFDLVIDLYNFDARLRDATFANLSSLELTLRALIGHELGRVHPRIHLDQNKLGATARKLDKKQPEKTAHDIWLQKYRTAIQQSREDFVEHHKTHYGEVLPVWVAVEVLDWGMLSHLYRFSPNKPRDNVAQTCGMTAPQLESWLKALNILRNYSAHHSRLFTRVFDIKPKRIQDPRIAILHESSNHIFGQLSLIRFLHNQLGLQERQNLTRILEGYPHNSLVPMRRMGVPNNWREIEIWRS
ncbi:Abi family protein [Corynebacterium pseudodiphtheriticum]|uniref:Abi family protein n=1 Tax=Corynebacterium pseudodiphtheriticum TaxID=37637 RepID=UPI00234E3093|nr:Abi family protein [Corynebacterium pseudodiphtheriticum]MDC7111725.1 Abi family protein [Corynebacterium pseudodiphtheriticum]MDC7115677.1 Abi family protein [Corynebacterium pseudodiphtheriticum]MDK8478438.1 Abi family protein [Corynebacterium pseudodiphtheriticum]